MTHRMDRWHPDAYPERAWIGLPIENYAPMRLFVSTHWGERPDVGRRLATHLATGTFEELSRPTKAKYRAILRDFGPPMHGDKAVPPAGVGRMRPETLLEKRLRKQGRFDRGAAHVGTLVLVGAAASVGIGFSAATGSLWPLVALAPIIPEDSRGDTSEGRTAPLVRLARAA